MVSIPQKSCSGMRMIMFTVLILEDDYEQQKAVSKIINEHYKDWQIFIAGTYKEACNLTSTKCFDLFLLDIELKHENENDLDCDGLILENIYEASSITFTHR